ncbi:MAG TPA: serine hydrolase, partial [Opitutus sp.]|nr:serine hydrolase [Opitutus sp.]
YASKGVTGVYAPGVAFDGPVFVGDIDAFDAATPALVLRSAQELRVTGGDLLQTNGKPVLIGELVPSNFTAGTTSHGDLLLAQPNRATFQPEDLP